MILSDLSGEITIGAISQLAVRSQRNAGSLYIFNPASEAEPLYVAFGRPAGPDGSSVRITPGDHRAWNRSAPDNDVYVYSEETGHQYTIWADKGRAIASTPEGILFEYHAGNSLARLGGTFSRASSATYTDSGNILLPNGASSGTARASHYIDGDRTLLLEEQRTNYCASSEDFTSFGTRSQVTITASAATAPDGQSTATKLAFGTDGYIYLDPTPGGDIIGRAFTFSIWVWSPTKSNIVVRTSNSTNGGDAVAQNVTLGGTTTRVSVTRTFSATGTSISIGLDNRGIVGGDGVAGDVYVWGAQLEEAPFACSYIPTSGSTVTRAADSLSFSAHSYTGDWTQYERYHDEATGEVEENVAAGSGPYAAAPALHRAYRDIIIASGTRDIDWFRARIAP